MSSRTEEDIAIIGLAGIFPGSADIHQFWRNILDKRDQIHDAPDHWALPWYDPDCPDQSLVSARIRTRKVGLLGELARFDPLAFGIPPKAVEGDPAHFLALQVAADALRDAGYAERPFDRERTGVIVGHGSNPNRGDVLGLQYGLFIDQTLELIAQLLPKLDEDRRAALREQLKQGLPSVGIEHAPTLVSNIIAGRIANRLDLMGPSYLVDAACASSLIAVDLGIRDLRSGRCDMVLVGGIQASMPAQIYMLFQQLGALAEDRIRPFDAKASGTLLSEGVGFAVLKRLPDAIRDGDRIYAVVKSVGVASDGKAMGLMAPRLEGEALAIRRAYEQSGIGPETIELIEAHGTGIPLGDRTEILALRQVFGERRGRLPHCAIGSVKSMIGHCIPAAGIASLIKTALALYHKILPPTLCEEVNPELELEHTPFYVNTETRPWIHPAKTPRRAAINAFGFGGINTHAILEEYRAPDSPPYPALGRWLLPIERRKILLQAVGPMTSPHTGRWPTELCVLVAESRAGLIEEIESLLRRLDQGPGVELAELAYQLWQRRGQGSARLAIIAKDLQDLRAKLDQCRTHLPSLSKPQLLSRRGIYYAEQPTASGRIALLFSSEGAQYPNMLLDLALHLPQIRYWFDFLDEVSPHEPRPSRLIFPPPTAIGPDTEQWIASELHAPDLATQGTCIIDHAIHELICDLGIQIDAIAGHSIGEYAALYAANMIQTESLTVESFIEQSRHLGSIYQELDSCRIADGNLISVAGRGELDFERSLENSQGSVYLVSDNCPNQRLIFVKSDFYPQFIEHLKQHGVIYAEIPHGRPYHTPLFGKGMELLRQLYEKHLAFKPGEIIVYSCKTVRPYPKDPKEIADIACEQWTGTVRFRETIEALYRDGIRVFIEAGPNNVLTSFVEDTLKGRQYIAVSACRKDLSSLESFQHMLGRLYVEGISFNLEPLYSGRLLKTPKKYDNSRLVKLRSELPYIRFNEQFLDYFFKTNESLTSSQVEQKNSIKQSSARDIRKEVLTEHFNLMQIFIEKNTRLTELCLKKFRCEHLTQLKNKKP